MARLPIRHPRPAATHHPARQQPAVIFAADGDFQFFRDSLVEAAGRFGLAIHAWCG